MRLLVKLNLLSKVDWESKESERMEVWHLDVQVLDLDIQEDLDVQVLALGSPTCHGREFQILSFEFEI